MRRRGLPPSGDPHDQCGRGDRHLDQMLIKVAEAYEENVRTAVKRFVLLLEPLIILFMGGSFYSSWSQYSGRYSV